MPSRLKPKRWPHFFEKKGRSYKSEKVLGQLYDRIELVDFTPDYESAFDSRILDAYTLEDEVLQAAAEIKSRYDTAMLRIMAQHAIASDFEVWSTFVMHHANQSRDFKFHEEIGQIASSLKETYRQECYDKAGSRSFEQIAPFAAAMYKVTSDQVTQALAQIPKEARTKQNMPMMSFPWLFPTILGRIASGTGITPKTIFEDRGKRKVTPLKKSEKSPNSKESLSSEDVLQTGQGITHRGEVLSLFHDETRAQPTVERKAEQLIPADDEEQPSTSMTSTPPAIPQPSDGEPTIIYQKSATSPTKEFGSTSKDLLDGSLRFSALTNGTHESLSPSSKAAAGSNGVIAEDDEDVDEEGEEVTLTAGGQASLLEKLSLF